MLETIVAISIVSLLIALALSAVQYARETARRMDCLARLGQLGKALGAFEATHRAFPSAMLGSSGPSNAVDMWSVHARLLPYVDQSPLFGRMQAAGSVNFNIDRAPAGISDVSVPVFECPSDPVMGGCSYRACTGSTAYSYTSRHFGYAANGPFEWFQNIRPSQVSDGLTSTVAMSEKCKAAGGSWSTGSFWYTGVSEFLGYYPPTEVVVKACGESPPSAPVIGLHAGNTWAFGVYDFTLYNHAIPPNAKTVDCSIHDVGPTPIHDADSGVFGARSYHSGGVNCLLMDGSARFVGQMVDLRVWQALSTRAGKEIVADF